jgi:hypothetical protein
MFQHIDVTSTSPDKRSVSRDPHVLISAFRKRPFALDPQNSTLGALVANMPLPIWFP